MYNRNLLSASKYTRIINIILDKRQYNENNLMQLIKLILILIKIDESNRNITIRVIKAKVSPRIYTKINNISDLFDILYELIHILNSYRRNQSNITRTI